MIVVEADYTVAPGNEEKVIELLRRWAPMAREEEGCKAFIVNRSLEDPRKFMLYEQYVDQEAFDFHASRPEFKDIVLGQVVPLLEGRSRHLYEVIA
ncbi:MAG: antibiotic biosynthesis monooxygenase [Thermomicrobiales bacterium]|nr:antibiotic biosynthesis monooxygenase [Thermomicrobiales bacterium]